MKEHCAVLLALVLLCAATGDAAAGWVDGGAPVCTAAGEQRNPRVVPDGAGGTIVVWEDRRSYSSWDLYAQRLSSTGDTLWVLNGIPVCTANLDQIDAQLLADGSGGAFVAWTDYRNGTSNWDIYMQRISSDGDPMWDAGGIAVCAEPSFQYACQVAPDDSGGVIVAWLDARGSTNHIYAQRISGSGEALWDTSGVLITEGSNVRLQIVADGAGGAIVVNEAENANGANLYAQRISRSGVVQWKKNGLPVCVAMGHQSRPQAVSDGAGGAIIAWMDFRAFAWDVYAQRISPTGASLWAPDGIVVCAAEGDQSVPRIVSDEAGGAIIAWVDTRSGELDIYAAGVTPTGAYLWPGSIVPVCTAPAAQQELGVAPDGAGGALMAWTDGRSGVNDVYAQRMSHAGAPLWTQNGVAVCDESGAQDEPWIATDGYGGAIAAWRDTRIGIADIFVQKIRFNGAITSVDGNQTPVIRAELLPLSPNPFSGELRVRFRVDEPGGAALKVFDVEGKLVRDLGHSRAAAGMQSLVWDCRDRSGRRVRSGVYFIRLDTAAGSLTRKAIVLE